MIKLIGTLSFLRLRLTKSVPFCAKTPITKFDYNQLRCMQRDSLSVRIWITGTNIIVQYVDVYCLNNSTRRHHVRVNGVIWDSELTYVHEYLI